MPLNSDGRLNLQLLSFLFSVFFKHKFFDYESCATLSYLLICHHQILLSRELQHIHKFLLKPIAADEPSNNFLYFNDLDYLVLHLKADVISLAPSSVEWLNNNWWAISFEDSMQSVNINFQVEKMLLGWFLASVIWHMQFHEFIKSTEPVTKRSILDSLFISYYKVV